MTQEEYEAKVQSMPKELQNQFRQSLEINLSKRIVNRLMSTVMQAYAWGQRAALTGEGSQNAAYMRGAQDMKDALTTVFDMTPIDIYKYFGRDHTGHWDAVYDVLHSDSAVTIMETVKNVWKMKNAIKKNAKKQPSKPCLPPSASIVSWKSRMKSGNRKRRRENAYRFEKGET